MRAAGTTRFRPALWVAALVAAGIVGYGAAWGAGHFGALAPLVLGGLAVLPALALLVGAHPALVAAGVFLLVPLGPRAVLGPATVIEVAVVAAAGVVVLTRRWGLSRPRLPAVVWWFAALLGWTVLTLPFALDRSLALGQVAALSMALLFLGVILAVCPGPDQVRRVLPVLLGVAALGTVISAFGTKVQSAFGGSVIHGRAAGFFNEPNSFGTLCMMAGLAGLALALGGAQGRWRAAAVAVAVVVLAGLLMSFSRGAWIGFTVGLVVLAASLRQVRRALVICAVALAPLALGLGTFIPQPPQVEVAGERLRSIVGERSPYDDRPLIWAEARREILARPLVGYGPANFPAASRQATSEGHPAFAYHAHNVLLTWGAEAGLPAVAILVGMSVHLTSLSRRARRRAANGGRPRDAALIAGLSAALAAVAAQGLVDYTLSVGNSVILVTVMGVVGLLLAAIRAEGSPAPGTPDGEGRAAPVELAARGRA